MSYFNDDDDDQKYDAENINGGDDSDDDSSDEEDVEQDDEEVDVDEGQYGGAGEEGEIDEEVVDIDEEEVDDEEEENDEQDGNLEDDENYEETNAKSKKVKSIPSKNIYKKPDDFIDDDEDDDDDGEEYLQKFDRSVNDNYIVNFHPESVSHNYNEILSMTNVVRNDDGIIIDKLHKTIPYLTKYERARILGQRAKQINSGAYPFVKVPENVIDGYIIAEMELKQKRIPFIIRRPLPNGGSEYWKVQDLEDISF
jgi:DNA-directed RNA polymerase I, II, and III subunit RPABC2